MQQETSMAWFTDPFTRRRLNDQIMAAAIAIAPEVLRRMPTDVPIDPQLWKRRSIDLASTLVAGFVDEKLI